MTNKKTKRKKMMTKIVLQSHPQLIHLNQPALLLDKRPKLVLVVL
jgi:hypothetical protein